MDVTEKTLASAAGATETAPPGSQPELQQSAPPTTPAAGETPAVVYDLKFPEGMEIDGGRVDSFKELCKTNGLTAPAAQALIDWQLQAEQAAATADSQQRQKWADEIRNSPDLGGAQFAATQASVARASAAYFTPELRQLFDASGLGDHPEMVRFIAKVGSGLREDRMIGGQASAPRSSFFPKSLPTT